MWKKALLIEAASQMTHEVSVQGKIATLSPTPIDLVHTVSAWLLGVAREGSLVVDLGCGDGRWVHALADKRPDMLYFGVDVDQHRLGMGRGRALRVELICSDLFAVDLSLFSVFLVYLSREANRRIISKIVECCLRPAIVVSIGFAVDYHKPSECFRSTAGVAAYVYLFE
jgi:SAM-dependent methyltransferase